MTAKFAYKPDPKLTEARAKLRDLQAQRETRAQGLQQLRVKTVEARDARDVLELRAQFEKIPTATLAAARAAYEAAAAELQAAETQPDSGAPFAYLSELIEQLESAERHDNLAALRPLYAERLRQLDAGLGEASAIARELSEIREAAGPLALELPDPLTDVLVDLKGWRNSTARATEWRRILTETGWLNR